MARVINTTTGENTARFGFRGTDLGYFTRTNHGYVLATFGDTFEQPMPGGPGWRSPVITRTHNADLDAGLKWDNAVGGDYAKQVVDYVHHSAEAARSTPGAGVTHIPNDVVHLPDGTYVLSAHVVKDWNRAGRSSWQTWCNRLFMSAQRDAEHWENTPVLEFWNDGEFSKFQNMTLVLWHDGYLYAFGTEQGRTDDGGIYLMRVAWENWHNRAAWEFWGWTGTAWEFGTGHASPILVPTVPGTPIGEINAQVIDGQVVLAYIDYGIGFVTRTALHPAGLWTDPQVHATDGDIPRFYAPSVHPYSTLERPYAHVSQWTADFYGTKFYALDPLTSAAPPAPEAGDDEPLPAEPVTEGDGTPLCRDLSALTAAELADVLTATTSVSADELAAELTARGFGQ